MNHRKEFLELVAKYCEKDASELTDDMRFREDLDFNSLSFMTFLGDLEDTFDLELEESNALKITTIGEAISYMNTLIPED